VFTVEQAASQEVQYLQFLEKARILAPSFSKSTGVDAEDLYQGVALHLWEKRAMIFAVENPHGYAYRTIQNYLRDVYRAQLRRRKKVFLMVLPIDDLLASPDGRQI